MKIFSPTENSLLALYWPEIRFSWQMANKGACVRAENVLVVQRYESGPSWLIIVTVLGFGLGLSFWKKSVDF